MKSTKLLERLPAWKGLILRSIASCTNKDQLSVAFEFIDLFKTRYTDILPPLEFYGHAKELHDAWFRRECSLNLHQVN